MNVAKIGTWMKAGCVAAATALLAVGCETSSMENEGTVTLAQLQGQTVPAAEAPATETPATEAPATESPSTGTPTEGGWPAEITGSIKWLHTDVSSWPVTASLSASVGGTINMPYSKARVWPAVDGVNANPWVIAKVNGQWYAGTFEWLRHGQTAKPMSVLSGGGHIKVAPMSSWRPRSGERIGLMVSGLARTTMRNVKERSNVVMVTWP